MSVNNSRLKRDDDEDATESHHSYSVDDDDEITDKKVHSSVAALRHFTSCQVSIAIQTRLPSNLYMPITREDVHFDQDHFLLLKHSSAIFCYIASGRVALPVT